MKNKKGTAEIIGSVMFIIILLFFFTNVYLWHDAAVKEMNDLQVQKINTKIDATITYDGLLKVTNNGAMDVSLERLWVIEKSPGNPDKLHQPFPLGNLVIVGGGSYITIQIPISNTLTQNTVVKVITTTGMIEPCPIIE